MKTYCRLFYRIPFSETDAMSIVHHSNHARYFERGRVEFLRLVGQNYSDIMKRGMHYPLTEMTVTFKRPLVFDEVILVETALSLVTKVRLHFEYKIFSVAELAPASLHTEPFAGNPSVLGNTLHCCVNNQGRPVEAEADIFQRLTELHGAI